MKSFHLYFFLTSIVIAFLLRSDQELIEEKYIKFDEKKIEKEIRVFSSFITNNEDSARYYLRKTDIATRAYPYHLQRGKFFLVLGNYYLFHSNFLAAEKSYRKILDIAKHTNSNKRILLEQPALFSLGSLATRKGKYVEGIKYFLENEQKLLASLELSKNPDSTYLKHLSFINYTALSSIYFSLNNLGKSSFYLDKSQQYLSRYTDSLYYFQFKGMLSNSNGKKSRYYFNKALDKAKHAKDSAAIKENLSNIGLGFMTEKKYKEAIEYAHKSINFKLKLDNVNQSNYQNYYILGISSLCLKKYSDAEKNLKKALVCYQIRQDKNYEYRTLYYLSKLNSEMGKFQKAMYYSDKYQIVKDSLLGIEKQNQIAQVNLDFELNLKQKQLEHEQKINVLFFVILGILLLYLLVAIAALCRIKRTRDLLASQNKIIEEQTLQLRKVNATKDKLFIIIGHDLRRPINNLVNFLYLLDDDYSISPGYLKKLRYNLGGVQLILENVLNWAESQIKNYAPKKSNIAVNSIVKEIVIQLQESLKEKNLKIDNQLDNVSIIGDENYLQIILRNIISNAIKFTSRGGKITIYSEVCEQETHIVIQDNGVGIDELQLEHIFEYPNPKSGTNNEKGSGLGLTLSYELIQKLRGDIHIKSKRNEGTSVILVFQKT